jgi:Ca-activated chloride channel family protein
MSFVNLQFVVVMVIPLLIFGYLILTDRDHSLEIFEPKVLARLRVTNSHLSKKGRNLLLLLALFWMIIAMGRPVIDHGSKRISLEGLTGVVALDISASMRTKDIYPNRLAFAKEKISQILDAMPQDEVSLIAFAHAAFMVSPFSTDKIILKEMISGISSESITMRSTDFGAMARFAATLLRDKKEKILIILSDGGDEDGFKEFASVLKKEQITPYLLLIGTKKGGAVLDAKGKPLLYQGKIPMTRRNDHLGEIAIANQGAYLIAQRGAEDSQKLVQLIRERHHSSQQGSIVIPNQEEYFIYPLSLAMLFLLLAFSSIPTKKELSQRVKNLFFMSLSF